MSTERLQKLLTALPDLGLDPELVAWVAGGLEAWKHRGADLEQALELTSKDSLTLDDRDELLGVVLDLTAGESVAARCCYVLDCLNGERHSDSTAARLILRLLRSRVQLPGDTRQLRRIMNGHRCEDSFRNDMCHA